MPLVNGQYTAPTWVNDSAPAINASELNAMSGAIAGAVEFDRSQSLTTSQKETARNNIGCPSVFIKQANLMSGNWSGASAPYTQTITDSDIKAYGSYVLLTCDGSSEVVFDMFTAAKIIITNVSAGQFTAKALGEKPTYLIPVRYVIINP